MCAQTPAHHPLKPMDNTIVVDFISNNETNYRKEVNQLATWWKNNNHFLNVGKTKQVVIDFRSTHTQHPLPLTVNSAAAEQVSSTKLLGVTWTNTISLAKEAQQSLYHLCKLT